MNSIFMLFILCSATLSAQQQEAHTEKLYGKLGVNIAQEKINDIHNLFAAIKKSDSSTVGKAAELVKARLEKEHQELEKKIAAMQQKDEQVPQELFFKQFIAEQQIKHFQNFAKFNAPQGSLYENAKAFTSNLLGSISKQVSNGSETPAQKLADLIMSYIETEREQILYNYDQLLMFLFMRKKIALPAVIDFWNTPDLQDRLKKRSKKISQPKVQFVEIVVNIALQAIILAGGSLAMEWEDTEAQQEYEGYQKQQNQIATDWQSFQQKLVDDQKKTMQSITSAFTKSSKEINSEYAKNSQQLKEEILYLNRSINLDTPISQALSSPILWDEYFENSVMNTPGGSLQWYNIFQVSQGDWQFDPTTNSFWQNGLAPFARTAYWMKTPGTASLFTDDPAANSIFTEYATGALTYDIEVEINLINITYPFFVGIIFNRGHWISGDPERIWQYRLAGLYGTQATASDPKSQAIQLCFAQQQIKKKTASEKERIIAPLEQIYKNPSSYLYKLDNKEIDSLRRNPTTFILSITTSPTTVSCTLSKKTAAGNQPPLFSKSISNLDNYLFMFSGIGFISSGCQAEFKITKPTDLQYTEKQLTQLAGQIGALRK
ncbi:hypothetical protein HYX58_05540 [Candidatus Dependentiae bacterium]|nr:hypothetical protein [Candidatus Dependentiae bacterium]